MRRVAALAGVLVFAGCAEGDSGVIAVPGRDSAVIEAPPDATLESSVAETGSDATANADADTGTGADTGTDSAIPDTGALDTTMPDTADTAVADTGPPDAGPPWTHTVTVDGVNDYFAPTEKFATTSTGYDAYVTWDADFIYVGYSGADIGSTASPEKWLFVYLDVDPGLSTGPVSAERYNTQAPRFPTGFGAEFYMRWRTDNLDSAIKKWDGSSWGFVTTTPTRAKLGGFVELKIPRATLGTSKVFGLVTFMLNEKPAGEWTYAGLYGDSFTDGYATAKVLTRYMLVDTTSGAAPNALSRIRP